MGASTVLNVVLNNFLDRPISAIKLNKTYLGAAGPYGTTSVVSGVEIPFGLQKLSWELGGPDGTPRNGELVFAKSDVTIARADIPPDTRYLGISLYPDYTIEIVFAKYIPYVSKRGQKILDEQAKNG